MKRKILAVALTIPFALYSSGCPTAQQWFQIAAGLIPIVLQTVSGFQTANGGLSPAAETAITNFSTQATTILNDISADISVAQSNTAIIPKIDAELKQLQTQANALIPQFTGNTKVLAWINAILADAIDIANLVPVVQQATGATPATMSRTTVVKMKVSLPTAKSYQSVFQLRLQAAQAAQ